MRLAGVLLLVAGVAHADPLVVDNCLACHGEELLRQQRITAKQWAAVVKKMIGWGAPVEPENVERLVTRLAGQYSLDAPQFDIPRIDLKTAESSWAPQPDGPLGGGNVQRGQTLYGFACAQCHAPDGHGSERGVNLADRPLLYRAAELAAIVRKGRGRMPAFPLSNAELAAILAYLRTL
jgi:mono/diheme cytochrome c family protein